MAEVDTSSYPKPPALPAQRSALEVAKDLGGLKQQQQQIESGALTINKQKLDQTNQALGYMTRAMGSLGPNATKEQYLAVGMNAVKMGLVPENMLHIYEERLKAAPTSQAFYNEFMTTAADHQQQIEYHLGTPGTLDTGNATQPIVSSPKPGFGIRSTGLPIARQLPPGTPQYDENNRQIYRGVEPSQNAPGMVPMPPPAPGIKLPIASSPTLQPGFKSDLSKETPNQVVQDRGQPAFAGPSPLFEEGKKAYSEDQSNASARMMRVKPAAQALQLMQSPGFLSGPGTEQFTKAVAGLKAWGLIDTAAENDPTAIRQEVSKKLAQYVSGNPVGQRSDAAQILAEASNPNPKVQILPALMKLTKDAIILDRVEAAKPNAFTTKDYENYIKHRGTFPQSIDERAFGLDFEKDGGEKLVDEMKKKLKSNNVKDRKEAEKFARSLQLADKLY